MKKQHDDSNNSLWPFEELPPAKPAQTQRHRNGAPAEGAAKRIEEKEDGRGGGEETIKPFPREVFARLAKDAEHAGGEWQERDYGPGYVGQTLFDTPASEDNTVTVVLPQANIGKVPAQAPVRIESTDGRSYLGIVVRGPFAEPDGIRGDSPIVVTTSVYGTVFLPDYHGRVQVLLLGEELGGKGGQLVPQRFRPLPKSPVYVLTSEEMARVLKLDGEIELGLAIGHEELVVRVPARRKSLWCRHVGILGTTGGGKSTTVSGLVSQLQCQGFATILIDTEGEYTTIDEPTDDATMLAALERRRKEPAGVGQVTIYHLVGRRTANPQPKQAAVQPFCLLFEQLSPYLVCELLEMTEAQQERYLRAYDITKQILHELKISPRAGEDASWLLELDELEEGYRGMRLEHIYDVVRACTSLVEKVEGNIEFSSPDLKAASQTVIQKIKSAAKGLPGAPSSWRALQGKLRRLLKLRIFDNRKAQPLRYDQMLRQGQVAIIDLSDTDSPQINNLVIAELLRGVHRHQDERYAQLERQPERQATPSSGADQTQAVKEGKGLVPVMVIIEEAHEFLSAERVRQMPTLFEQVARMARRGRKRWLGLVFVTQLPQHLPDEVLGLINNVILHKITDANVISRLKRSIGGIDEGLWTRLPNLAPGQAIVALDGMIQPFLVAIDPTPCKLRMVD
ncbi:MAG: ATP-binding protein [Thermogemmatispora sp.]|uniref:ATP-binding protein n=1 Tax=Thermogemmatispora sp. TaxID=1968838 RepID=UPI001A0F9415|nr:ATP-binding protein [Thermogemmatispora sp.]MBE3566882.1 ATP-binding protein [Thermogemmatispora sp.]